ncbi:hypothetical protein ZWY2020_046646 [Hordeum vulgare]|nr:hypothetical protein ZWY2020_046646 [Hordeum vulgare]
MFLPAIPALISCVGNDDGALMCPTPPSSPTLVGVGRVIPAHEPRLELILHRQEGVTRLKEGERKECGRAGCILARDLGDETIEFRSMHLASEVYRYLVGVDPWLGTTAAVLIRGTGKTVSVCRLSSGLGCCLRSIRSRPPCQGSVPACEGASRNLAPGARDAASKKANRVQNTRSCRSEGPALIRLLRSEDNGWYITEHREPQLFNVPAQLSWVGDYVIKAMEFLMQLIKRFTVLEEVNESVPRSRWLRYISLWLRPLAKLDQAPVMKSFPISCMSLHMCGLSAVAEYLHSLLEQLPCG